jgi:hypothetical protein
MGKLFTIGRIFYGIAITEIGLQAIYCRSLPYIVPLPDHFSPSATILLAIIFGLIFTLGGLSVLFMKAARPISLLFGTVLLLLFFLYYIPYELLVSPNYMHFPDWENAEKELAFAGGALFIAGCFSVKKEEGLFRFLAKLIPLGAILFAVTILSFGILHFMLAKEAASYIPAWIPWHLFWMYFCGAALIGSGVAIIFKVKTGLFAMLLGIMIFIWFAILHTPRVIAAPAADMAGELSSAFFALGYSGIAFAISGAGKKTS